MAGTKTEIITFSNVSSAINYWFETIKLVAYLLKWLDIFETAYSRFTKLVVKSRNSFITFLSPLRKLSNPYGRQCNFIEKFQRSINYALSLRFICYFSLSRRKFRKIREITKEKAVFLKFFRINQLHRDMRLEGTTQRYLWTMELCRHGRIGKYF